MAASFRRPSRAPKVHSSPLERAGNSAPPYGPSARRALGGLADISSTLRQRKLFREQTLSASSTRSGLNPLSPGERRTSFGPGQNAPPGSEAARPGPRGARSRGPETRARRVRTPNWLKGAAAPPAPRPRTSLTTSPAPQEARRSTETTADDSARPVAPSHAARGGRRAGLTLTSHTPVFCLAPVRSSSPRSAMGLSPEEARDPEQRLRELGSCGDRVRNPAPSRGGNPTVKCPRPPAGKLRTQEKRSAPPGAWDCACARAPSGRRAGEDKLPGAAAFLSGSWR